MGKEGNNKWEYLREGNPNPAKTCVARSGPNSIAPVWLNVRSVMITNCPIEYAKNADIIKEEKSPINSPKESKVRVVSGC